jgi:hypothetical protein
MAHGRDPVKVQVGEAEGKHGTSGFRRLSGIGPEKCSI